MRTGSWHKRRNAAAAIGALVAAGVVTLVFNREAPENAAGAFVSEPAAPAEARDRPARKLDALPRAAPVDDSARAIVFFQDYFNRNYFAYYYYASPPRPAGSTRSTQAAPATVSPAPTPAPAFTTPSLGDLSKLYKIPAVSLSVPLPDVTKIDPAATVSVAVPVAPSVPIGILTNTTPFHLFVTSEPVVPSTASTDLSTSSTSATSSSLTSSSSTISGSSLPGATAPVTGAVGTLLHR